VAAELLIHRCPRKIGKEGGLHGCVLLRGQRVGTKALTNEMEIMKNLKFITSLLYADNTTETSSKDQTFSSHRDFRPHRLCFRDRDHDRVQKVF
jgi:hypothetical protein